MRVLPSLVLPSCSHAKLRALQALASDNSGEPGLPVRAGESSGAPLVKAEVFPSRGFAGSTLWPGQPAVTFLEQFKDNAAGWGQCWGPEEKTNTRSTDRDSRV